MNRASASLAIVIVMAATAFGVPAGARQRSASQPGEASRLAREKLERQLEEENRLVEEANARAREEEEKIFQATRQERADFDRKMDDFADKHSKDAGTHVTLVQSVGENGLPERGEVWFVRKGFITDRAEFDANGNTAGLFETPNGRALRSYEAHRPQGVEITTAYSFTNGPDGRTQISSLKYSGAGGVRGEMRFNQDGVAYYGEFFAGGQRTGGFYDPRLEWRDPPPRALEAPPLVRPVTQPCEPCRAAAEAYNDLVRQMAPMQNEMAQLAKDNGVSSPGVGRQAIEMRFDALKARWDALAPQLEAARAKLRACQAACMQPSGNLAGAVGNGAPLTKIEIEPSSVVAGTGELSWLTPRVTATGYFSDGHTEDISGSVTWSSDSDLLSIDNGGLIRPSGTMPGVATILASLGALSDDATVTLADALHGIAIQPPLDPLSTPVGFIIPYQAVGNFGIGPDDFEYDITNLANWSISATSATISPDGRLTSTAPGIATVTATFGPFSDDMTTVIPDPSSAASLIVVDGTLQSITIQPSPVDTLPVGVPLQFAAQGFFSDGNSYDITTVATWTTSNPGIATISPDGRLTSEAPGPVTVTAALGGTSAQLPTEIVDRALTCPGGACISAADAAAMQEFADRLANSSLNVDAAPTDSGNVPAAQPPAPGTAAAGYENLSAAGKLLFDPDASLVVPAGPDGTVAGSVLNPAPPPDIISQPGWDSPIPGPDVEPKGTYTTFQPAKLPPDPNANRYDFSADGTSLPGSGPGVLNFDDPSVFDQVGGTNAGDRDPAVQYMIIELVVVRAARLESEIDRLAGAARTLWDVLRGVVTAPALSARHGYMHPAQPAPWRQANRQGGGGRVQTLLTSLGTSTGEAFEIQVAGDDASALNIGANGVVVEPLKRAAAQRARQQVSRLAGRNPLRQKLDAYCIEFLRQPPSAGTIFRVASPELQKKFAPMRRVLQASQRLQQAGQLQPDSDPKAYFAAIKQWALWTRERSFDEKAYGDAFVEHTKKNAKEAGVQWTRQIEDGIRALVPGRWRAITQILQAAGEIR